MKQYRNTHQQGVKQYDREDQILLGDGLPEHGGVPRIDDVYLEAQENLMGVPMPGPDLPEADDPTPPIKCAATTKQGYACKGYTVGNSVFCMVHDL